MVTFLPQLVFRCHLNGITNDHNLLLEGCGRG